MDEERVELMKENIRLTKENNKLLRKLWKAEKWGFWTRILTFAILIGIPVLVYQYYLSDVFTDLQGVYEDILDVGDTVKEIPEQLSVSAVIGSLEERGRELID